MHDHKSQGDVCSDKLIIIHCFNENKIWYYNKSSKKKKIMHQ